MVTDDIVDLMAKTRETGPLSERSAQVAKPEAVAMVAETRTNRHAQLGERQGRSIGMTMFQAEVGHAQHGKIVELPVGKHGGREDGEQNLHERKQIRVFHCWQIGEGLDRTLSDALTQAIVFLANLVLARMNRPFDSKPSKLLHSDFDRANGAVQCGIECNT